VTGVADRVVALLAGAGVRRAYTVPGESFLPLLDALERSPDISLVSTRHESGAAFMAEADAKLSGVPAVALGTRAVGAANLAIGVHTAYQDSTPMVVLVGQVETADLGREAFQEVDLPAFYAEITKWSVTAPSRDRLPELISRGLHVATTGRPGPVMIAIPADLLEGDVEVDRGWNPGVTERALVRPEPAAVDAIARALDRARNPVIIAGGGAQNARAELVAVAERYSAGVYASFRRQDVFPNSHPLYLGHLTLGTPAETLTALSAADVVLVAGSRLSEVTTQRYTLPNPAARLFQIDVEPRSIGAVLAVEIGVTAGCREVLGSLAAADGHPPERDWTQARLAYEQSSTPRWVESEPIHPETVMAALRQTFPADTIVTTDAGNFTVFAHRFWRFDLPRCQLSPISGAMGYGVPAGVAAALAEPGRQVIALAGDGGFLMSGHELEVAVRLGLSMTVVVFRNGLYGTIALHQGRQLGRLAAVDIGPVDIAGIATALGASSWSVATPDELKTSLAESQQTQGVRVIDVRVDPDVLTPSTRLSHLLSGNTDFDSRKNVEQ
jgi:acetolactate synthase-1/2/3 large subunit